MSTAPIIQSELLVELAVHRVLRGELAPCIHAVTADLTAAAQVSLHIFHHSSDVPDWCRIFEEDLDAEWSQVFPLGELASLPALLIHFHRVEDFVAPAVSPKLIYVSPWSHPAA